MESLWVPLNRGFRDGTTSLSRDGVRLTSHSLYLELVGWVGSPRQQLDSSMAYHVSAQSRNVERTGCPFRDVRASVS